MYFILFLNKYYYEKKPIGVKLSRMEDTLQILDNDVQQINCVTPEGLQ
jgi:hypothetical protein